MSREVGDRAEERAALFLQSIGFEVLCRNYAIRGAEVDIIAKEHDIIAFVEIKYRKTANYTAPRETVTPAKKKRIQMAAERWLQENNLSQAVVRFDIVEVLPEGIALLRAAFDTTE